jgi:ring-1,2-phenylacetyl-CoA epoxidase subunit PaaE
VQIVDMPRFHSLFVKSVFQETPDSVSISLEVPTEEAAAFAFKAGQYLTFRVHLNGEELRRTYSICSGPNERELRVGIKRLEGGKFSTWANTELRQGQSIEVMPPMGRFVLPESDLTGSSYVAFASGSGITPVLAMIKEILIFRPQDRITLFYGNRFTGSIMFREEIEGIKNRFPGRFALYHILSGERPDVDLFKGRIDAEKVKALSGKLFDLSGTDCFLTCGPGDMITQVKLALQDLGVKSEHIRSEMFAAPGAIDWKKAESQRPSSESKGTAKVSVVLDGLTMQFPLDYQGLNILDAALEAGADVPYACKGAVCATCKAKIVEGRARMDLNYALSPEEVENGYVLCCQAHPESPELIVNFDH